MCRPVVSCSLTPTWHVRAQTLPISMGAFISAILAFMMGGAAAVKRRAAAAQRWGWPLQGCHVRRSQVSTLFWVGRWGVLKSCWGTPSYHSVCEPFFSHKPTITWVGVPCFEKYLLGVGRSTWFQMWWLVRPTDEVDFRWQPSGGPVTWEATETFWGYEACCQPRGHSKS